MSEPPTEAGSKSPFTKFVEFYGAIVAMSGLILSLWAVFFLIAFFEGFNPSFIWLIGVSDIPRIILAVFAYRSKAIVLLIYIIILLYGIKAFVGIFDLSEGMQKKWDWIVETVEGTFKSYLGAAYMATFGLLVLPHDWVPEFDDLAHSSGFLELLLYWSVCQIIYAYGKRRYVMLTQSVVISFVLMSYFGYYAAYRLPGYYPRQGVDIELKEGEKEVAKYENYIIALATEKYLFIYKQNSMYEKGALYAIASEKVTKISNSYTPPVRPGELP